MSDAALDATAEALARRLLSDLPADRPRPRADLGRLPSPVARLLGARLDARVDRAAAPPDTPWVDADAAGLLDASRTWREAARSAARFPAAAWEEEVDRATRLALSHLVRPAETLAAYAFENDDEPLAATLALRRIRAFAPYPYLPEIAGRYVERKGLGQIDRAGLERLLRRIDRRMVSAFGVDEWMTLLEPLFDLAGPVGTPEETVPASLLHPLFEAKDADDLAEALTGTDALSADALRDRIRDVLPADEPLPVLEPPTPASPSEPEALSLASDEETADASASTHPESGIPLDTAPLAAEEDDDAPRPPVIGSRYGTPEEAFADDSEILGPARAVAGLDPEPVDSIDAPTDDHDTSGLVTDEAPLPADEIEWDEDEPEVEPDEEAPQPFDADTLVGSEPTASLPLVGPTDLPKPPLPRFGADLDDSVRADTAPEANEEDEPLWRRLVRDQGAEPDEELAREDETPLWKRFAQTDEEGTLPSPPAAPDSEAVADDAPTDTPLHDLERRVLGDGPDERRAWFVAELFSGSPGEYHRTLASLGAARSWTEATEIIAREVFRKHRVNIYSEPAVAFTDAVEARMSERA